MAGGLSIYDPLTAEEVRTLRGMMCEAVQATCRLAFFVSECDQLYMKIRGVQHDMSVLHTELTNLRV